MSLTIDTKGLSFTIWGAGHDYTLADSGDGEVQVFSHPFVPLNSVMYAGQWYFLVPDENGEPMDAVKDDMAHCTFTPALGSTFDTEGEVTVECHYHREYIYDEETLVVDKTVSQKITVVNHGSIVLYAGEYWGAYYCSDVYSDGYMFMHPKNTNNLDLVTYCQPWYGVRLGGNPVKKVSSFYWRVESLGAGNAVTFLDVGGDLEDIDELRYADISKVTYIRGFMVGGNKLNDLEPLSEWDFSNVTSLASFLTGSSNLKSLHGLEKANVKKVKSLANAFQGLVSVTDWSAISGWDMPELESMYYAFAGSSFTDLTVISGWDIRKVKTAESCFRSNSITSLHGLEGLQPLSLENMDGMFYQCPLQTIAELLSWNAPVKRMYSTFEGCDLRSLHGLENLNTVGLITIRACFKSNGKLLSLDGIETWVMDSCQDYREAFYGMPWLEDISAVAGWNIGSAEYLDQMFYFTASILTVTAFDDWDFANNPSMGGMLAGWLKYYSPKIGKEVYQDAYYYWDYDGRRYIHAEVEDEDYPMSVYSKSASGAESWNVSGSGLNAFDDKWNNVPSWN